MDNTDARLPSRIWVEALVRRAQVAGAAAFIVQAGDDARGDRLVKVSRLNGTARVMTRGMGMDGTSVFIDLEAQGIGPDEASVDAYIARARVRDSDLWVIEIEDPAGRHFITEVVEGDAKEMQPDHSDVFKRRL